MVNTSSITTAQIRVSLDGSVPGDVAPEVRRRVGAVLDHLRQPVLSARVRLLRHGDPAVTRPVDAQANVDVNGRVIRVQVEAETVGEALAQLEEKLRHSAERAAARWKDHTARKPGGGPHEWRHIDERAHRPSYFPRAAEERRVLRHKTYGRAVCTVDEAAFDMDALDYDFYVFTELGSGEDSVLYRAEPTGYRLAQLRPAPEKVATGAVPLTISDKPAAVLSTAAAVGRLNLSGQPFLFFRPPDGHHRGRVLYRRFDGHYGLITPAQENSTRAGKAPAR
jgi:ribosome-associated translation inhibitor RaiA